MRNCIGIFVLGLILLAGCSEENPAGNNDTVDPKLTVTINDGPWSAQTIECREALLSTFEKEIVGRIGEPGLGESITISLPSLEPGTYDVDQTTETASISYIRDNDPTAAFESDPVRASFGQVTITVSNDSYIAGEFHFAGTSGFSGTNVSAVQGVFEVEQP